MLTNAMYTLEQINLYCKTLGVEFIDYGHEDQVEFHAEEGILIQLPCGTPQSATPRRLQDKYDNFMFIEGSTQLPCKQCNQLISSVKEDFQNVVHDVVHCDDCQMSSWYKEQKKMCINLECSEVATRNVDDMWLCQDHADQWVEFFKV